MADKAKWTFMIYLAGDNNLSGAGDKDMWEMRQVGSTPDINIVAEFDNAGDRGTNRYHVQRDGKNERVESLGETDSGSPATLVNFVNWTTDNYPAERYALILWNHGSGWRPEELDRVARSINAPDYNGREVSERSASPLGRTLFRSSLEAIFQLPTANDRAICSDDGSGHSLDTIELGRVLKQVTERLGQPFDILGMDACLMSNLEVAYQAQPYVRYTVASEELEPNDGWPYDVVLSRLVAEPGLSTQEFATHIVRSYVKSYKDRGYLDPVTQASLNLSQINKLTTPLDHLATALIKHMPAAQFEIWNAQRRSVHFLQQSLWDVAHFCEELERATTSDDVTTAARTVRDALQPGPENFVLAEAHHGARVEKCGGVTVYLLPPLMDISRYYAELKYAKNHQWGAMLEAYHAF